MLLDMARKKLGIDGKRIYELRGNLDLAQFSVVDKLKDYGVSMSQSHLSGLERGVKSVSVETLIAIAFVLDTTTDYLTGLTDDPSPRVDLEDQVLLVERDPIRREYMQRMFTAIERMPSDRRDKFWNVLSTLYVGVMAEDDRKNTSRSK